MFEIGASLAAAREAQGLQLADAERLTCLRAKYLKALEEQRFDDLPGRAYGKAFLRSYASALGLEAEVFVKEFDERFPPPEEEFPELVVSRTRLQWGSAARRLVFVVAAVAALGGIVAWGEGGPSGHVTVLPPSPSPMAMTMPHARSLPALPAPVVAHPALVLTATRGPCWLLVRSGSVVGPVLYEGMLEPGKSLEFKQTVWVRLGAPWNIDARRGARVIPNLSGTGVTDLTA